MRHPALEQRDFQPLDEVQAAAFRPLIEQALTEDAAADDVTTSALVPPTALASASLALRSPGIVAGLPIARLTFHCAEPGIAWASDQHDGMRVSAGAIVARLEGRAQGLLRGERVALNFLGRLCGIATLTRAFVDAVSGFPAKI